jgi:hypothetical protein
MQRQANITSIEAIEAFRARLIVYENEANVALDEVREEIAGTRVWLQHDRRGFWGGEVHRLTRALEQARQQLQSDRLFSSVRSAGDAVRVVHRTERALAEAEKKRRVVIQEARQYDVRMNPLAQGLDRLRSVLDCDVPKAVAYLTQVANTLHAYTETPAGNGTARSNQPGERKADESSRPGGAIAEAAS